MDFLTLIGVVVGFAAIVGGNWLEGGQLDALLNGPAALIVVGGTLGASILQTPWRGIKRAFSRLAWLFLPPALDFEGGVGKMVRWAMIARKDGLLGLDAVVEKEPDAFARKGLQLLIDGAEPDAIRDVLESDSFKQEQSDVDAARFFEAMGGYAPTIGIIGAVIGLIQVMGNLAEPSMLGSGIAVAFVATIYGVGLANLVLIPAASKLKHCARRTSMYRELLIEGIAAIAEGENPRSIELKLSGYVD